MKYLALFAVALSTLPTQGAVSIVENFAYSDGSLDGQNEGTGFSGAYSASDLTIVSMAVSSNPSADIQNSTVSRAFVGFSETSIELGLGYDLISDNEGQYEYTFTVFDSNNLEVLSVGIRNDLYSIRLGTGSGAEIAQNVGGNPFTDDVTLDLDFTNPTSTLSTDSQAFSSLNGTLSGNIGIVDFSSGGRVEITKAFLDQNEIQIDNFFITVPEPTSIMLILASVSICSLRRKRA